jgi:uncharacterized membrane protein YozB (DUF420 family)
MGQTTTSQPIHSLARLATAGKVLKATVWTAIVGLAVGFVFKYVFHYYLHYNAAGFDPYWPRRGGLLLHITGGTIALLTGPWQFWTGFRRRHMRIHRWTGRLFLVGVLMGSAGAVFLAVTTTFGWPFGFALLMLATAWLTTTGMAYYAIRRRLVEIHKEWMIRAYVVTFAFVTFRLLNDFGPPSHIQPEGYRAVTYAWLCWAIPLLITEVVLQLRRMGEGAQRPA